MQCSWHSRTKPPKRASKAVFPRNQSIPIKAVERWIKINFVQLKQPKASNMMMMLDDYTCSSQIFLLSPMPRRAPLNVFTYF
jgi:hypothetical protein